MCLRLVTLNIFQYTEEMLTWLYLNKTITTVYWLHRNKTIKFLKNKIVYDWARLTQFLKAIIVCDDCTGLTS